MAKLRVHELAKLVNKTSKEVLAVLRQQGEDIQSHMSTVNEEQASKIKARFLKMDAEKEVNTFVDTLKNNGLIL